MWYDQNKVHYYDVQLRAFNNLEILMIVHFHFDAFTQKRFCNITVA